MGLGPSANSLVSRFGASGRANRSLMCSPFKVLFFCAAKQGLDVDRARYRTQPCTRRIHASRLHHASRSLRFQNGLHVC